MLTEHSLSITHTLNINNNVKDASGDNELLLLPHVMKL